MIEENRMKIDRGAFGDKIIDQELDWAGLDFKAVKAGNLDFLINPALDLYNVPRTGWLMRGISENEAETVGEHTEAMTHLFNEVIDRIDPDKKLDRQKMLKMIQIHDWAEGRPQVGDQVTHSEDPLVEAKLKRQKKEDEIDAMQHICSKLGNVGNEIMELWNECETQSTPEGDIVKQIDKLQAIIKAYEYESVGEKVMAQEFINSVKKRNQIAHPVLVEMMHEIEGRCKKF